MPREFSRNQRLGNQVLRTLADLLRLEVKDPRVRGVALTAVDLSRDLSVARVYFSLLDPDDDPGAFIMTNAGEILTQGLEVDFVALLSHNWRLYGGLAIIDATIEDYENGPCSAGQQFRGECDENNVQDLSGGDMPFSPDWKLNVTADYTWNRDQHFDMVFRGSLRAQDEVQFWLHQDENTIQDSYAILDASVQFLSHSDRWETTLFVKNLTDEFYASNIFDINSVFIQNGYFHRYAKVAERTYGLEARFRW